MTTKPSDTITAPDAAAIVIWTEKYATGVEVVDDQHKELVNLTNQLYQACLAGNESADTVFKRAMHRMVEYVRFHFGFEQNLLERANFPMFREHKQEHDKLIRQILDAVKNYEEGKKFVPNQFVRTLKDWVFSHIAVSDKVYAAYIATQRKMGLLSDQQIKDMMQIQ